MFEDFATTGKGPGLIGVLLGGLVLAGFTGLGVAVFYDLGSGGDGINIKDSITAAETQIEMDQSSITKLDNKLKTFKSFQALKPEISINQAEVTTLNEVLTGLKAEISGLNEAIESENLAFTTYRQQYRINERALARNEVIDLSSIRGDDYQSVEILRVDAEFLQVRTPSGPKGIPYAELPPDIQDRFQFSEDEAAALAEAKTLHAKKQNKLQIEFDKKMAVKKGQRDQVKRLERMKSLTEEVAAQQRLADKNRNSSKDSLTLAGKLDGEHNAARASGKMSMKQGLATQARNKAKLYNRAAIAADKKARTLQAELDKLTNQNP